MVESIVPEQENSRNTRGKVPANFHGKKGRSGRKRNPRNITKYFNEVFDQNSYVLVEQLIDKAKNGDKEMLIYCFDRRLGKPKATTEIEGGEALGAGIVLQILQLVSEHKRKQLTGSLPPGDSLVESNPSASDEEVESFSTLD